MTTLTQLKGLVEELSEYAENHHDVDCVGDPPRFVSNEWGEVLRIVGGMEQLVRRLERLAADLHTVLDVAPTRDPDCDLELPSWKSRRGLGE